LFFGAQRRRDLPAVGRRKEIGENLSDLPEAGRLYTSFYLLSAQRRRGAKKKPLGGLAAWRANFFFSLLCGLA
jgi:hypothetical protein